MSEGVIFAIGAVMFTITTSATFLFLMLRFNEVYEKPDSELETLEGVGRALEESAPEEDARRAETVIGDGLLAAAMR